MVRKAPIPHTPPPLSFYLFASPIGSELLFTLDSGQQIAGEPCDYAGRADAYHVPLPPGTPIQGATLEVSAEGYTTQTNRGILNVPPDGGTCTFVLDDIHLQPAPSAPPPETESKPDPTQDPFAIIRAVYEEQQFNLATKEGCGLYTEAACEALHDQHHASWGHIAKKPEQNQFNGHAVDAIMLLYPAGTTVPGIYDIILSTESPDAEPAWSFKGPPDVALWYYPAKPL